MDYKHYDLIKRAKHWAQEASQAGWLSQKEAKRVDGVEDRTPDALFSAKEQRPLVVAFFGGTGVGKSTLLNRLAGQPIARTGVERPTSREVSIYLHESVHINQLPREFPVDKVRIAHHRQADRKGVLWIDMPDMDSVEQRNRELALEWLPHIDVLIYVVSPERYRDDTEWRLLLSHGQEHAWLFVMNHWDRGQEAQLKDFEKQLKKAGFQQPIILHTDCREEIEDRKADDFDRLKGILQSLADTHAVKQLQARSIQIRLQELKNAMQQSLAALGKDEALARLEEKWEHIWQNAIYDLRQGLEWPIQEFARAFVTKGKRAFALKRPQSEESAREDQEDGRKQRDLTGNALWDRWAQNRLDDALDQWLLEADALGVPALPFKAGFDKIRPQAPAIIQSQAQQTVRQALANPGNIIQRIALKLTGFLATLLPLLAISWVGYQVVTAYYNSVLFNSDYLGVNFAIHSTLLVVTVWLIPYFIHRKLKPSLEKVAHKGLKNGVMMGLELIEAKIRECIDQVQAQRLKHLKAGQGIIEQCALPPLPAEKLSNELLSRMLLGSKRRIA